MMKNKHLNHRQTKKEPARQEYRVNSSSIYRTFLLRASFLITAVALLPGCNPRPAPDTTGKQRTTTSETPAAGPESATTGASPRKMPADAWQAPDNNSIPPGSPGEQIRYGRNLIAHTANYLGPKGSVASISNGMNCQNCHLDGGAKFLGNNYSAVYSTYPKFRARSGTKETIVKRISDCFERSLNGKAPDSLSKEMKAMIAYFKFLGTGVKKGTPPVGAGLEKLAYLDRPADPSKGAALYQSKCAVCHGAKGEGVLAGDQRSYTYPPLWGGKSYNDAAGLYRISNFAGYIKNNMPLGATYDNPMMTDEEAWDIAAFVNSQSRPHKDQKSDWKDISKKPVDYPFGPYADNFSEKQHKFGPFGPIKAAQKNTSAASSK